MWQTLLGTIVGGLLTLAAWSVQDFVSTRRRRTTVKAALAAEINSIVELVKRQRYAEELRRAASSMRQAPRDVNLTVPMKQTYFSIYEANASAVGELEPRIAVDVVRFYQGGKSLVDALSETVPYDWDTFGRAKAERYEEIAGGIDALCKLGTELADRLQTERSRAVVAPSPSVEGRHVPVSEGRGD